MINNCKPCQRARYGGVIGVTFVPAFIDLKKPTIDRLLDHIDHIIEVTGINHVGIGSDFDGGGTLLKDATDFPKIVFGLKSRGYSYGDIKKIMGGNIFRIIKEVIG
jgi:membrane dipeptidase